MIEDLEADLTGSLKKTSNTDYLAVAELTGSLKKNQILTIWRWLKRKMLMNPSLQKPRLEKKCKLILQKNEKHKHLKRQ